MIFLLTQLSEMHGMGRVKMYAIIKTVYFFDWMPWTSTRSSQWQVFLEINLNKILLKLYTSWVHRKNQCRSTVKKHALLWGKREYQHSAETFVKNKLESWTLFMALATILNTIHGKFVSFNVAKIIFILFNTSSGFF